MEWDWWWLGVSLYEDIDKIILLNALNSSTMLMFVALLRSWGHQCSSV